MRRCYGILFYFGRGYIVAAAQVTVVIVFRSRADEVVSGEGGIVGFDIDLLFDIFYCEAISQLGMHKAKGCKIMVRQEAALVTTS
jgi:hypothetical protein